MCRLHIAMLLEQGLICQIHKFPSNDIRCNDHNAYSKAYVILICINRVKYLYVHVYEWDINAD